MRWTPQAILEELRARHQQGGSLSYRSLAASNRALVSAAAYHFGSFKNAITAAGIDYASVSLKPRWTKARVILAIKSARRRGEDLSWTAVTASDTALRKAAYVAVQQRMFGGWPRALQAAGVDGDESRRYQKWDKTVVVADLKQRYADGLAMNSAAVQEGVPSLHAAAIRYFGTYDRALRAAKLTSSKVRRRSRARRD